MLGKVCFYKKDEGRQVIFDISLTYGLSMKFSRNNIDFFVGYWHFLDVNGSTINLPQENYEFLWIQSV